MQTGIQAFRPERHARRDGHPRCDRSGQNSNETHPAAPHRPKPAKVAVGKPLLLDPKRHTRQGAFKGTTRYDVIIYSKFKEKWRRGSPEQAGCSCGSPGAVSSGPTAGPTGRPTLLPQQRLRAGLSDGVWQDLSVDQGPYAPKVGRLFPPTASKQRGMRGAAMWGSTTLASVPTIRAGPRSRGPGERWPSRCHRAAERPRQTPSQRHRRCQSGSSAPFAPCRANTSSQIVVTGEPLSSTIVHP